MGDNIGLVIVAIVWLVASMVIAVAWAALRVVELLLTWLQRLTRRRGRPRLP